MIVSWNWLSEYVGLDMPVAELTHRLAMAGLNHESTEEVGGDLAIDVEVTSNRPDCLCHIGVAREVAVLYGRPLKVPDPRPLESGPPVESITNVRVEDERLCPHFTARVVSGVTVGESPWWLRRRLETLGIRPISNVVDVTNYVLFECGQPLHAYDLDRLNERRLEVRCARAGEKLTAINGKTYDLSTEMLAIADGNRPVGLAGVMGGLDTEIHAGTSNVLIEAAQFDAVSVRRTSRALGLFSPSSFRFERGLDPHMTDWASRRCAQLILELCGGTLAEGVISVGGAPAPTRAVTLRQSQIPRVLGIDIPRNEVLRILRALGFELLEESQETATFRPPSWRADIEREIDLIEEVARIYGYDHIPEDRPVPLTSSARGRRERVEGVVKTTLTGLGFDEAYTFSLVAEPLDQRLDAPAAPPSLKVEHSSRKKENALRQSLIPSLVHARAYNEAHGNSDVALFELAQVYHPVAGPLPDETTRLALVGSGGYLEMKGVVEQLIAHLHISDEVEWRPAESSWLRPGRSAEILLKGTPLGLVGELSEERAAELGLRSDCVVCELRFEALEECAELVPSYRPIPQFPAVERDISLVVRTNLTWAELADAVRGTAGPWLESLTFHDTFTGGNLPAGHHSLHFGLRFRHTERTLTGEEVDRAVRAAVAACEQRFGASLRSA